MRTPRSARPVVRAVAVAVLAVMGLGACHSTPSAKRVALDMVERVAIEEDLSDRERDCMRAAIEEYDASDLDDIADSVEGGNPEGSAALAEFEGDIAACRG